MPKYSPDLNDIEHDFSASKRARMYSHIIIREYSEIKLYRYLKLSNYFPLPIKLESKGQHIQRFLTLKEFSLPLF